MKTITLPCYNMTITFDDQSGVIKSDLDRDDPGVNVIESFVLALAVAGVDMEKPKIVEAIETAIDAVGNHCEATDA